MPNKIDVTGQTFGRATVISESDPVNGRRRVLCRCSCGSTFVTEPRMLRRGKTKSCGCWQRDAVAKSSGERIIHGRAGTPEYNTWQKIKGRCENETDAKYPDYGGRGIRVCDRWRDFETFFADMGLKPSPQHSIERNDVNGDYAPENCRWATPKEQARNKRHHRRVMFNGALVPLSEACELAGVNYRSALYRLNRGKDWQPLPQPPAEDGE